MDEKSYEAETASLLGIPHENIHNRFRYHKPGEAVERNHERVRETFHGVAVEMEKILPKGRESAFVQTKLEEAMFWANAAIARSQK